MILSSSSTIFLLLFAGLPLAGEFTSLVDPIEIFYVAVAAVFLANGPKGIRFERRREPKDPT
jgi:hypothetical protein